MTLLLGVAALGTFSLLAAGCEVDNTSSGEPDAGPVPNIPSADGGGPPVIECPKPTAGPTKHEHDVGENEVWTADASPHILEWDVNVRGGHKLTIEPCAEVLVKKGKHIHVAYPGTPNIGGTLIAEGTATKPIRFAGYEGENWASIYVHAPGTARLAHVTFENGGGGDFEDGATIHVLGDSTMPAAPLLYVDHVTVTGSTGTGVWMERGATFLPGSKDLTITKSGNDDYPFPIQIEEHAIDALPTGSYKGNKIDEILLRSKGTGVAGTGLPVDATLHERGVPYRMGRSKLDDFRIGPDKGPAATLTIEAGVVMRFEKETAFKVQHFITDQPALAAVRALGTAERPVVFTSASATPAAGDWRGLWFGGIPHAQNKLEHVRIEYAGFDCGCTLNTCSANSSSDGAIVFTRQVPSAFVTNTVFKEIAGHAVTQGFDGDFVNFRPTNTFEGVSGCEQTLPRPTTTICPDPKPACDGL
ncbi:MAG TPA: hypothetical protein VM580_15430 [Labilithrix sp.]|nr:hypothetical protein [Labilithrix sp.]